MLDNRIPTRRHRSTAPARDAWGVDPLESLHREMDRLFDGFFAAETPAGREMAELQPRLDVREGDEEIVIDADLPGVAPDDVQLSVRDDLLTLEGRREETRDNEGDGWHRRERVAGGFSRTIRLPFEIEADRVRAKSEHGVLHVHVPKPATGNGGARRIPIAQGEGGTA
jgi:HSP20 family protein